MNWRKIENKIFFKEKFKQIFSTSLTFTFGLKQSERKPKWPLGSRTNEQKEKNVEIVMWEWNSGKILPCDWQILIGCNSTVSMGIKYTKKGQKVAGGSLIGQ